MYCHLIVEALLKMLTMYAHKKIDLFKNCVTVPSAARHLIFNSVNHDVNFALCDESQKDIHTLFRKNICGGPSIVMCRHQERDVTKIRNDKTTKKVVGYELMVYMLGPYCRTCPQVTFVSEEKIITSSLILHHAGRVHMSGFHGKLMKRA